MVNTNICLRLSIGKPGIFPHLMNTRAAVFLDRDGTLNEDRGYVTAVEDFVLLPGVCEGIARLNQEGFLVIVITNQSALARGLMTEEDLSRLHEHFADLLRRAGAHVDAWYFCPHHPEAGCECRKPRPGMIQEAVRDFGLDVSRCFFVGDKESDLEAAQSAEVAGVLVKTSPYAEQALAAHHGGKFPIAHIAESFPQAIRWMIQAAIQRKSG